MVTLAMACIIPNQSHAQQLPHMHELPWAGFFSGYTRHGFEFGVNNEGLSEIYLIGKDRKRIGASRKVKIYTEVIVEDKNGKRSVKRLKTDEGLVTDQQPGLKHKKINYTALCTGDAKVQVSIQYSGNKITMDGKVIDRGSLKNDQLYLSYKVVMPAMYTNTYANNAKKEKARMKKDRIRFVRAKDGKSVSLKSYEKVNLLDEDLAKDGVTKLSVSMDGQEGRDFEFTTTTEKGTIRFENKAGKKKGRLWQGYLVKWERAMGDSKAAPFVIEVK